MYFVYFYLELNSNMYDIYKYITYIYIYTLVQGVVKFAGPWPTPLGTSLEVIERCLFHLLSPQQECRRGLDVANLYLLQATVVLDDELAQFLATFLAAHMAFSEERLFQNLLENHLQYPYLSIFTLMNGHV